MKCSFSAINIYIEIFSVNIWKRIIWRKENIVYLQPQMVDVAQLVRALDCGSRGRGFKSHLPPIKGCKFCGLFYF